MKFQLTFKTPGVLDQINSDEFPVDIAEFVKKWMRYEEYITVEFDVSKGTATVVRQ